MVALLTTNHRQTETPGLLDKIIAQIIVDEKKLCTNGLKDTQTNLRASFWRRSLNV